MMVKWNCFEIRLEAILTITEKVIKKVLHHEISLEKIWAYWTTPEGLKAFFCEDCHIELTPFGAYEVYFSMDWPIGERGSEGCEVLSYLPKRMLSFTWNAPTKYDVVRNHAYKTWVVLEFDENTLILTHLGWPEGQDWDDVYNYFDHAWSYVFEKLNETISKAESHSI